MLVHASLAQRGQLVGIETEQCTCSDVLLKQTQLCWGQLPNFSSQLNELGQATSLQTLESEKPASEVNGLSMNHREQCDRSKSQVYSQPGTTGLGVQ